MTKSWICERYPGSCWVNEVGCSDGGGDEHHEAGHDDGDDEQERDGGATPTGNAVPLEPVDEAMQQKDEQRCHDDDGYGLPDDAGDVEQKCR